MMTSVSMDIDPNVLRVYLRRGRTDDSKSCWLQSPEPVLNLSGYSRTGGEALRMVLPNQ